MRKTYLFLMICECILLCFTQASSYGQELEQAYTYAYSHGITTMQSIETAGMYSELNRIAMAKMLSNFAINILGLRPDTSLKCVFSDVSESLDKQYNNGVTKACQLGLMGIGDDGKITNNFNPYEVVTRGQFATAFSRALNRAAGTSINNGDPYYRPHINYLYNKGVINNLDTPANNREKRGYVMLMMQRADNGATNNANDEKGISCNTNESCLEQLNKLREKKHELTCVYDDNKDAGTDYIIEGYVAIKGDMLNMLSTNQDIYLWGKSYGENIGIHEINTGENVVAQQLSAFSKVMKLGTKITCTPGVTDKSIFQLPDNIKFMSTDEWIQNTPGVIVMEETSPGTYSATTKL